MKLTLLITGGLGDIGLAVAAKFQAGGWRVALNDLAPQAVGEARLAEALSLPDMRYFAGDNTDPNAVAALVAAVEAAWGVPQVVAINAGTVEPSPLLEVSPESWRRHLDTNLSGAFFVAQAAARRMQAAGTRGNLLFTGSWVQDVPSRSIGPYCATKAGLKMLARQFALELASSGIRANVIAPGVVDAGLSRQMFRAGTADPAPFLRAIPLHQIQTATQVADAFWLLAQPEADYITGATLLCDGGMSLYNWQES